MKKFALLVLLFTTVLTSCSLEDDGYTDFYLEVMPIDSVDMPESFVYGETYQIDVTYTRPNPCYYFNDFIYEIDGHQRTVAVVNTVYADNSTCDESGEPEEVTVHFNFKVLSTETYIFKFYQGEDEDGVDEYYIVEVPVVNERSAAESSTLD